MPENRRLKHRFGPTDGALRLDAFLEDWLPAALGRPLARSAIRRLIAAGVFRLNGHQVRRASWTCSTGDRLEGEIDVSRLPNRAEQGRTQPIAVLFEDAALLVVNKPAGLQMHRTADPARSDLFSELTGAGPELRYLGLHHRLDRDTSGVVLFTKDPKANAELARQFNAREVEKRYRALVPAGVTTPETWVSESSLGLSGTGSRARMVPMESGGASAVTRFEVLERWPGALLVEAKPETGRKHQVRAHLAERQLPILGDVRYGGPTRVGALAIARVMLHAWSLRLRHPLTGEPLLIHAPYPDDFSRLLQHVARSGR